MKKYIILLESNAKIEDVIKHLRQINSTKILISNKRLIKIETEATIGYIDSIPGIKIVEEEILHYCS